MGLTNNQSAQRPVFKRHQAVRFTTTMAATATDIDAAIDAKTAGRLNTISRHRIDTYS